MPFAFHLPWLLVGLVAVVVPILIHLLNRRRFEVVDWGAMRFLEQSQKTRRKVFFEDFLLLLLRIGLIALLVFALAGPFLTRTVSVPGSRPARDVVLVVDGSASMGCLTAEGAESARDAAVAWANGLLDELQPGDAVGLVDAREQPAVLLAPTVDHERVRRALAELPPPEGGCDAPAALDAARRLLKESNRGVRDVLVLTDGQKAGYADAATRLRWEILATQEAAARKRDDYRTAPTLRLVTLDQHRTTTPPNWSLGPLRTTRGVVPAGREVLFRGEVEVRGKTADGPPHRVSLLVDGKPVRDLGMPGVWKADSGKVPFSFTHRFPRPGSHLVTVVLEPDPPKGEWPEGFQPRDFVPGDNRQDFALEVVPYLPVLLVDGGDDPAATDRGVVYLRSALAPAGDPAPAVRVTAVGVGRFEPASLVGQRVVVLQDVAGLTDAQNEAIERFLNDGGGVLVALGPHADAAKLNDKAFREGRGWLPARLDKAEGDENKPEAGAKIVVGTSAHPAMELFREVTGPGSIETARFPRYWLATVPGGDAAGSVMAMLRTPTGQTPFLVERPYGAGKVVLCTVPLDAAWGATLPRLPAMVPMVNELVSYLAGVRTAGYNLAAGEPLRFRSERDEPLAGFTLRLPGSDDALPLRDTPGPGVIVAAKTPVPPRGMALSIDSTRRSGVYRLGVPQRVAVVCPDDQAEAWKKAGAAEAGDDALVKKITDEGWLDFDLLVCTADRKDRLARLEPALKPRGLLPDETSGSLLKRDVEPAATLEGLRQRTVSYVVGRDRAEADLTPLTEPDKADLTRLTAAEFLADRADFAVERRDVEERPELWWMLLLGLVGLLCGEVWLTSRIVRAKA